ncbi:Acetyl esterase/lipase [Roseomonas rosea]|uniref:Acetyl esterase/lipase n=1 Tax=Muricoccus roseus TaxID=198092 RepID=A0A1M6KBJ3_9PROT|nr:alpha/beta hydrolase [Roseomonas rosea]SHJ56321.1 Acetyl esterase/lipase [Roseomonas rosea]
MIPRRLLLSLPLVATACSPFDLANGLTPAGGTRVSAGLPYGAGDRARYDLYTPEGAAPDAPLLIFFYGGGWRAGERADYAFAARSLASLGVLVAVPDYRLFPEVRWPAFVEDGAAAVRAIRAGEGKGRFVFLIGHSAGAFIALALATDPRWLGDGRATLAGAIGLAGPYAFGPEDDPRGIFTSAPEGHARVAPADPLAIRGAPPLLLLQGEADHTVRPAQATRFASLASAQGVSVTTRLYPGLGHVGIGAALAPPLRALGLEGAPVLDDIRRWLETRRAAHSTGLDPEGLLVRPADLGPGSQTALRTLSGHDLEGVLARIRAHPGIDRLQRREGGFAIHSINRAVALEPGDWLPGHAHRAIQPLPIRIGLAAWEGETVEEGPEIREDDGAAIPGFPAIPVRINPHRIDAAAASAETTARKSKDGGQDQHADNNQTKGPQ